MNRRWMLLVPLCVGIGSGGHAGAEGRPATRVRLLVPAYFYPDGAKLAEWDKLFASPARPDVVAIVNPASGPGKVVDPNYTAVMKKARKAGVLTIGYVSTSYARRPLRDVEGDVEQWLRLYPGIRGIFFDEQASDPGHVAYQAALYDFVRKEKGLDLVVTNPGTSCDEGYLSRPAADVVCLAEGPLGPKSLDLPSWATKYAPSRIYLLPYKTPTADEMRRVLRTATQRGAGTLYITDASGVNPWDRLPTYWDELGATVVEMNREAAQKAPTAPR
jgi:hypothetical protein